MVAQQMYLNISVKDLHKTKAFFSKIGFTYNPHFTNENGAGMIVGENIYVMLLTETFFQGFIPHKKVADAKKMTEALIGISVESRKKVDLLVDAAVKAGGKEFRDAQDHGWMYARAFEDLDGHIWEVIHTDESKMPQEMKNRK